MKNGETFTQLTRFRLPLERDQEYSACRVSFIWLLQVKIAIILNNYSMKQPDLYYFGTIKMTSQAWSNFVWRIRAAGDYSL